MHNVTDAHLRRDTVTTAVLFPATTFSRKRKVSAVIVTFTTSPSVASFDVGAEVKMVLSLSPCWIVTEEKPSPGTRSGATWGLSVNRRTSMTRGAGLTR